MSYPERKKEILTLLEKFENLSVMEIAQKLSISPATVRRDLLDLSNEGLLTRTHGGAMKLDYLPLTAFNKKQTANDLSKQAIGKLAAEQVTDGDIIFMDCGSTVFTMCPHLKKISRLKIITNSLPIVAELIDVPGISINLIGGELDAERKAVHGEVALQHINNYHADKAFIGIDGFSVENGLSSHSEKEASITKAFIQNAGRVYLLCDASKIGKDVYLKLGLVKMVSCLITNSQLEGAVKDAISEKGITVLLV
jgi:DeoR family fructose operon transcriptional repressor